MIIIGHRGAPDYEPENTLRSFEKAIGLGVDMIELDVYILPTGEVVVFHDRTLERTTNGVGLLLDMSFDELRKLDAGKGERIPTLQEVLDLVDRRVPVMIELKNVGTAAPVAAIIEDYVVNYGWTYDLFGACSFHHLELSDFKAKSPHIQIGASTGSVPLEGAAYAEELQASVIVADINALDQRFIDDAHKRGLKMYVYTITDKPDVLLMIQMGVDGIFSNQPDVSRAVVETVI
jgi:glycerophosphoryl diester phosphodiesterase